MRFDKRPAKKSKTGYTWRVSFDYTDRYGKKRKYSKSGFATKKAAEVHGHEVLNDLQNGLNITGRDATVNDVFQQWKDTSNLSPNTLHNYINRYNKYIHTVLGDVPIVNLHYLEVQTFINTLSDKGYTLVQHVMIVLEHIFTFAIKAGITNENPVSVVENKGKKTVKKNDMYISYADFQKLKDRIYETRDHFEGTALTIFLDLGYYAGLRIAEICALRWEDVDLETRTLSINQQLQYVGLKMADYKTTPVLKTSSSSGSIPIPEPLVQSLKSWREQNPYDLVVCGESGWFLNPKSTRQALAKVAKRFGLDFNPHMLRHTYVTNLILSGADPKTASELARHSNPNVTLKVYTEINDQRKVDILEKAFSETPDILA